MDLRVKPEDDKGGETPAGPEDDNTKNCPKMTMLKKLKDDRGKWG